MKVFDACFLWFGLCYRTWKWIFLMSFVLRDAFGMCSGCVRDALGKSSAPNHLQNYGVFFSMPQIRN